MMDAGNRMRRGVIFDFDGTLVDTLDDITSSINELLANEGLAQQPPEAIRGMIGEGLHLLLERASGIHDGQRITELVNRYRPVYAARMLENSQLYLGVPDMLDHIAQAGIPMSVLSNKPYEFTAPMCDALMARWSFAAVLGADDGMPKKPDPTGALKACDAMQLAPADVVFVGDSTVDVATARNAGMTSVAVTWGFCKRDTLRHAAPAFLISHPADLAEILSA